MSKVYIITDGTYYKIGKADDAHKRLQQLQTGNPKKLSIIYVITLESARMAYKLETYLHQSLKSYKILNEWFDCAIDTIYDTVAAFKKEDYYQDEVTLSLKFLEVVNNLSTSEINLLTHLYNCVKENLETREVEPYKVNIVRSNEYTHYLKNTMMKQYRHLYSLGLITRICRGVYEINKEYLKIK